MHKRLKILAIDDNGDNLIALKAVIDDVLPGSDVLTALNGPDGIAIALAEDPDVILLDIVMPQMDGFEVCRIMKKNQDILMIPVLILTSLKTDRQIRLKALDVGAEAFLSKPFDETELMAQIQAMAKIKEGNDRQCQEKEQLAALVDERTYDIEQELLARRRVEHELMLANQNLKASEARYKSIFDQSPLGIAISDAVTGQIHKVNQKFADILGRTADEVVNTDWVSITHPDDLPPNLANLAKLNDRAIGGFKMNKRYLRPDGSAVWVKMTIAPLQTDGGAQCHLSMIEDISESRMKEQRIEYLSYHDMLTDLYNRAYFEEEIDRLDRGSQLPLSTITGDINGLKLINDTLGHQAGDKLLVEMAKILAACARPGDVLARVGGDEFSLLLPRTDSEETRALVEQIYTTCNAYKDKSEKDTVFLSMSLGHATKTTPDESFNRVIKNAEDNMYKRKLLEHKSFHSSIIALMRTALFEKSHETEEHAARLVDMSVKIGKELRLREEQLSELELLSTLHDIGKISVDDHILTKADKLSEDEWREMKKHPTIGYRIAMASPELEPIAEYILCHHERWDGQGYPQGLSGEDIPLLSRILAVVDAYDAMTEDRAYRKAMSIPQALQEIEENSGTQFDPNIAALFISIAIADQTQITAVV